MLPLGAAVFVLSAGECKHPNSHKTPAAQPVPVGHITAAVMHGSGALDSSLVSLFTIFVSCINPFLKLKTADIQTKTSVIMSYETRL